MCTVTYVPKDHQSFILTSSRDESIHRQPALAPEVHALNQQKAIFPKDAKKGGTWIGFTDQNRTCCLLNGAFKKHAFSDQFTKSRGIVVLDFFNATDLQEFINKYSFNHVEPFTLIILESQIDLQLFEFRWDGQQKHLNQLEHDTNHIWSSSTLYTQEQASAKSDKFIEGLNAHTSSQQLFHLHENGISTDPEIFKYHGIPGIKTLSITQIEKNMDRIKMRYKNLYKDQRFEISSDSFSHS